jgi:hypothetical protein
MIAAATVAKTCGTTWSRMTFLRIVIPLYLFRGIMLFSPLS